MLYVKGDPSSRDFDVIRDNWIDRGKDWNAARTVKRRAIAHLDELPRTVVDFGSGNGRSTAAASSLLPSAGVYAVDFQEPRPLSLADELRYLRVESSCTLT